MRKYCNLNNYNESAVKKNLKLLADKTTGAEACREAFRRLGIELGKVIRKELEGVDASGIMLACTSEDADWLASGLKEGLDKGNVAVSVYWNDRSIVYQNDKEKIEIAPIIKAYEEPIEKCKLLIVVKSINSSSCIVKTLLTRLIGMLNPERIVIAAPVMYKDGQSKLMKEFPNENSEKFFFVTFAIDDEIVPGIGGTVYNRPDVDKMHYMPMMVAEKILQDVTT